VNFDSTIRAGSIRLKISSEAKTITVTPVPKALPA